MTKHTVPNNRQKSAKEPFDDMSIHTLEALVESSKKAAARYSSIAALAAKSLKRKKKDLRGNI